MLQTGICGQTERILSRGCRGREFREKYQFPSVLETPAHTATSSRLRDKGTSQEIDAIGVEFVYLPSRPAGAHLPLLACIDLAKDWRHIRLLLAPAHDQAGR